MKYRPALRIDTPAPIQIGAVTVTRTASTLPPAPPRIPAPDAPSLTAALSQTDRSATAILFVVWRQPDGVQPQRYLIQLATDGAFTQNVETFSQEIGLSAAINGRAPGRRTYVRVAAVYASVTSDWSEPGQDADGHAFIDMPKDTTVAAQPTGAAGVWTGSGTLRLTWGEPTDETFKDVEIVITATTSGAQLGPTRFSSTGLFEYTAAQNVADTGALDGGAGLGTPALTVRLRSRTYAGVVNTNAPVTLTYTLAPPAPPSGLGSSWDADTASSGLASGDVLIRWDATPAVARWRLSIDGVARELTSSQTTYTLGTNSAEHTNVPHASLALSLVAIDGLGQASAAPATRTAANTAPPSFASVSVAMGFSALLVQCPVSPAADFAVYQLRIIKDGATLQTLRTASRDTLVAATARGSYQVGVSGVDVFGSTSAECLSASVVVDALSVAENRADTLYTDDVGSSAATLDALKDGGSTTWVGYAGTSGWHWTQAERPSRDRIRTLTLCTWHGTSGTVVGYVMTSADGSTWRFFAGPQSGSVLTEVASEAAAQAAAVAWSAFPTMARWDLPGFVEARFVKVGHRNTAAQAYNLRELYPRRLTQTDDLDVEAVRAINIGAKQVTADHLSVLALSAVSGDMGSLTAGQIVIGAANKLWLNDADDGALAIGGSAKASAPFRVTAAGALTATNASLMGTLTLAGGAARLDANGISVLAASDPNTFFAGRAVAWHDGTLDGLTTAYLMGAKSASTGIDYLLLQANPTATAGGAIQLTTPGPRSGGGDDASLWVAAGSNAAPDSSVILAASTISLLGSVFMPQQVFVGRTMSADTQYLAFDAISPTQSIIRSRSASSALLDITANADDGTSTATIRLFREVNTTGTVEFHVVKGDGGNTWQHRLSGHGSDSFLARDNGNLALFGTGSFGGGDGVLYLANRRAAPSSNPGGGGVLYVENGALKYRGSAGSVTPLASA